MDNKKATLQLGTEPVGKLLWQYASPAIVAMVASSLYNMVDSIFIGQGVGPMAISGLAITFPFMNLSGAIGACIGVGASTYLSVKLGQKDYSKALKILGTSTLLKIITGIVFGALCLIFLDPILRFFGATDNTIPYARDYMQIILLGNVFTHLYFGMNALLRAASKPRHAMYATIFTVVLNTLLDPLFIYTFGMGIRGAAVATVLSQTTAMCWQIWIFSNPKELLHYQRGIFKFDLGIIKNILAIGVSPLSMNACACIVVIFINTALVRHGGDLSVGAYGIANRIGFIFFMVVMGINQGMQPIAGYNYGAEQYDRMLRVLNYSMVAATCIMTVGWLVGELMPKACARLFTTDEQLREVAERCNVFGRVTPAQKKKLVLALKENGHKVAMTGDGVNDVLALKEADCSVAMASGSEAARNVSQLVLVNNDFGAMPHVVAEGRRTINNIERSSSLYLVKTIYSILLAVFFIFSTLSYPFQPIQLSLISTITVAFPSFVLALQPNKNIVRGNFTFNIIARAAPAAFCVVLNVILVTSLSGVFGISQQELSTVAVCLTALICLMLIVRLSIPFNALRTVMLVFSITGMLIAILFFSEFFMLVPLQFGAAVMLLVCATLAAILFNLLYNVADHYIETFKRKK